MLCKILKNYLRTGRREIIESLQSSSFCSGSDKNSDVENLSFVQIILCISVIIFTQHETQGTFSYPRRPKSDFMLSKAATNDQLVSMDTRRWDFLEGFHLRQETQIFFWGLWKQSLDDRWLLEKPWMLICSFRNDLQSSNIFLLYYRDSDWNQKWHKHELDWSLFLPLLIWCRHDDDISHFVGKSAMTALFWLQTSDTSENQVKLWWQMSCCSLVVSQFVASWQWIIALYCAFEISYFTHTY